MSPWRQRLKWAVYALLFVNFLVYLYQDVESARYTLDARSDLLEVLAAYVTSIDLVAWFTLILLFELETGPLAGRAWTGAGKWSMRGLRLACYAAILHTSFSNDIALRELYVPVRLPDSADVCTYAGGWTFLRNREYIEIDAGNCTTLGPGPAFYALSDDRVLTDAAGLREARVLAWTDLAESLAWLLVVLATELAVRLKQSSRGNVALAAGLERLKSALYVLIFAIAAFWGTKGQLLYFWDELVWLLGFSMIDWNIRDWRRRSRGLFSVSPIVA
jgi:hypothetical protein